MIAGSVGNLPRVHNMDIQYAQSGVFTPCDFAFPTDGKRAEATPNTEMILVSDVDLDLLNELHTYGSVRNLKDRRGDLYEVKMKDDFPECHTRLPPMPHLILRNATLHRPECHRFRTTECGISAAEVWHPGR